MSIARAQLGLVLALGLVTRPEADTRAPYQTGLVRWTAARGLGAWRLLGLARSADGALTLDPVRARHGAEAVPADGGAVYNGGAFLVGEAVSPETPAPFAFSQAIASWAVATPAGTWTETLMRARRGGAWTRWYSLGVWASEPGAVERHSVEHQGDADGTVDTDTLLLDPGRGAPEAFEVKVRLFSGDGLALPRLDGVTVALSTTPQRPRALAPGDPALWGRVLDVPECSQMVYPDGGEVWCSPTSVSMALKFWRGDRGACETQVKATVAGVYDRVYDGHGNWPFNAAYAHSQGFEAYVARFTSLAEAERWIAAGVPVVMSYAWGRGELDGAPVSRSSGHLVLLVGFDAQGNPIINDPAAPRDADVRRTYRRAQVERLWLEHSGGAVYLVYPAGHGLPAERRQ